MKRVNVLVCLAICCIFATNSQASVEVVGSLKHKKTGSKGELISGQIKIQNSENDPQEVMVYQTDLLYNYLGLTDYNETESHPRSNKNWIKYSPQSLILQPQEVRFIQYEITVPDESSVFGTYWSVIMVQGVNSKDTTNTGELTIKTITRYAIQIVTEIDNPGEGLLKFLEPTLLQEGDKLFLAIDIENTGDHYISPEITMELFDQSGQTVKKITALRKGLYPTTSARFKLDLEGLKSEETYQCLIVAVGENEDVFGLEYTLFF